MWTPATTEAFATYGNVTGNTAIAQPLKVPKNVVLDYGGIDIGTTSTELHTITDAFLYLLEYRFECSEQIASRILSIAVLKDVMRAFDTPKMPSESEIAARFKRDIAKLKEYQHGNGGFSFWGVGRTWPYLSIHVGHALARAKIKGYNVSALEPRLLRHLKVIERYIPHYYSKTARLAIRAYSVYVRALFGDDDVQKALAIYKEAGRAKKIELETAAWIAPTLQKGNKRTEVKEILRMFENRADETPSTAAFTSNYEDGAYLLLHSNRRTDAIILDSMLTTDTKNDLVVKVMRGLLAHKTKGRWGNTQENVFVLTALEHYFREYEKVTPNFVARAWLGDTFAAEHKFVGRTTDRKEVSIPMRTAAKQSGKSIVIEKQGKGRLYYRLGMRYAPKSLKLKAADYGFAVQRVYEAIDDPGDVKKLSANHWQIKAGAKVRVRLTMAAESRRYHVALVDPMPAGLESLNPALAVTEVVDGDPKQPSQRRWYWNWTWYQHQNLRDERAEAFTTYLNAGVYEYTYNTTATTPGRFVVPPAKAEEMYMPEVFGRSASAVVEVIP